MAATALGVPFANPPALPDLDWPGRLAGARTRAQTLARTGQSMFGRAISFSAYAIHMATYHMEHDDLPPPAILDALLQMGGRLVDRALGPADTERRATGVPLKLQPGHPATGGCGLVPLVPHIRSRHAKWTVDLALAGTSATRKLAPWQRVVAAYLSDLHPAFRLSSILTTRADGPWLGTLTLPPDIRRLVTGLAPLPPLVDVAPEPSPLGPGALACRSGVSLSCPTRARRAAARAWRPTTIP
jgi:hypothetical protein